MRQYWVLVVFLTRVYCQTNTTTTSTTTEFSSSTSSLSTSTSSTTSTISTTLTTSTSITTSTSTTTTTLMNCGAIPCKNGATCLDFREIGYLCKCASGFLGQNCEIVDVCVPNPCQNNGECVQFSFTEAYCKCKSPFTGGTCEYSSLCNSKPCLNGGICTADSLPPYYKCYCLSSFSGFNCEVQITTTKSTTISSCTDVSSSLCDHYSKKLTDLCTGNYYISGQTARSYCIKTCNACPCYDEYTNCNYWSSLNYCNLYPVYNVCKFSCNLC